MITIGAAGSFLLGLGMCVQCSNDTIFETEGVGLNH
jgi:hypothetical protein